MNGGIIRRVLLPTGLIGAMLIFIYLPVATLVLFSFHDGRVPVPPFQGPPIDWYVKILGNPRWAVGSLGSLAGGNVPLIAHRPHCPACPLVIDWAADGRAAGSLQINYVNRSSGTLSTAITLPAPFGGDWTRSALPIQPIAEPVP